MNKKFVSLCLLIAAQMAALSLWFSTAAIMDDLQREFNISAFQSAALSASVQAGFVLGALFLAISGITDRFDPRRLFACSAGIAALANLTLLSIDITSYMAIALRAVTGAALAGVYPIGIKLAAGWGTKDRGFLVGLLVGALTLGSALPHLVALYGGSNWRFVVIITSGLAFLSAFLVMVSTLGPHIGAGSRFNPKKLILIWTNQRIRYAYIGYFGHMIELYAMWAWLAVAISLSFAPKMGTDTASTFAGTLTFWAIALGALSCAIGGRIADHIGKAKFTIGAMALSGSCAIGTGLALYFGWPVEITTLIIILWGISIIPDSPQFSALVADACDPEDAGSILTMQTALGFLLTIFTVQGLPILAEATNWPIALAALGLGPALGIPAMARHAFIENRNAQ